MPFHWRILEGGFTPEPDRNEPPIIMEVPDVANTVTEPFGLNMGFNDGALDHVFGEGEYIAMNGERVLFPTFKNEPPT